MKFPTAAALLSLPLALALPSTLPLTKRATQLSNPEIDPCGRRDLKDSWPAVLDLEQHEKLTSGSDIILKAKRAWQGVSGDTQVYVYTHCKDVTLNVVDVTTGFLQLIEKCGKQMAWGSFQTPDKQNVFFGINEYVPDAIYSFWPKNGTCAP